MKVAGVAAVVLVSPLLLAASDPRGDVETCVGGAAVGDPAVDLVEVDADEDELGTAAVWTLRFASAIRVPDTEGAPLRIDVLVRDPRLPPVSRGGERGMNRIVRWVDTSAERPVDVIWLPGDGHTPFTPPVIRGRTIELGVPGRILLGEAADGTASVRRVRWSVLVRDGGSCDRLGDRPTMRLRAEATQTPQLTHVPATGGTADDPPGASYRMIALLGIGVILGSAVALAAILRRTSR